MNLFHACKLYINFVCACVTFFIVMKTAFQKVDIFKKGKPDTHPCGGKCVVVYEN